MIRKSGPEVLLDAEGRGVEGRGVEELTVLPTGDELAGDGLAGVRAIDEET
jgi:hypothetical protein